MPALSVAPNPIAGPTTIRFDLAAPARASLRLLDTGGRTVQRILEGDFPAEDNRLTWEPTRARPGGAPAGVYFLLLEAGDQGRRVQRVVVTR